MIYSLYDTQETKSVPVVFGQSGNYTMDGRKLKKLIDSVIDSECVENENVPEYQ